MRNYFDVNRLYRDSVKSKVSGVCAGLARHWQQPTWLIRIAAIACFLFLPVATAVAYIVAVVLIPSK
jgi:phage shock protein C